MLRARIAALVLLSALLCVPALAQVSSANYCFNPTGSGLTAFLPCQSTNPMAVAQNAYPVSATAIIGVGTGTTGAVTGTLAAAAGKTTYICGFDVSAIGGTAAVGPVTITGLVGGTFTYQLSSAAAGNTLSRTFTPCIPGNAVNTAIVTTTTADGTATGVDVNSWGFQQ